MWASSVADHSTLDGIDAASPAAGIATPLAAAHESLSWHIATFRGVAEYGRYRSITDIDQHTDQAQFMSTRTKCGGLEVLFENRVRY
jgi:hypothetical protein